MRHPRPAVAPATTAAAPDPRLARTLWQWLALGSLVLLLVPPAREPAYLLGNLHFWLVWAPGLSLALLYRDALATAWRRARP